MTAGEVLREARERHGLGQRELAELAGTSQSQVSRIERGETSPTVQTLARLLAAAGERLELSARPVRGNQSTGRLRADFHELTAGERLREAAALSRTLTDIAARADG